MGEGKNEPLALERIADSLDELVTATLAQGLINAGHPSNDAMTTATVMRKQARGDVESGLSAEQIADDYIAKIPGLRSMQLAERDRIQQAETARLAEKLAKAAEKRRRRGAKGGPGTVSSIRPEVE